MNIMTMMKELKKNNTIKSFRKRNILYKRQLFLIFKICWNSIFILKKNSKYFRNIILIFKTIYKSLSTSLFILLVFKTSTIFIFFSLSLTQKICSRITLQHHFSFFFLFFILEILSTLMVIGLLDKYHST